MNAAGILRAAVELAVLVLIVAAIVRLFEPRMAFFPTRGETTTPREVGVEAYQSIEVATSDGERLRTWTLQPAEPRAAVLYFHGNGGNLSVWAPILAGVARQGFAVFAFDYRGYGLSTGRPSEAGLYRDVEAVVAYFRTHVPAGVPVIYWGRSLGASMAAYAATLGAPDGLVLESGFPDVSSLVRTSPVLRVLAIFSTYRFPCAGFLARTSAPVLVMHGDADGVIPFAQGRLLFEDLREPKRFFTIHGGDHNDVAPPDPRAYWDAIRGFVSGLRR